MGSPAIYGYKAGTYVATGGVTTGQIRASVIEPKKTNGWIWNFTARVGKAYAANPTAWLDMAIYNVAGPTSSLYPTTLVGEANTTVAVTGLMQNSSQGVDVSKAPLAPIKRFANVTYALALRSDLNHFNFGMNASGQRMAFRTHGGAFPASYAHSTNNPNGRIGMWADEITNTPPKMPSSVAPAESSSTTDVTPTMAADFRDDEETLPGFAIGTADKVKKYQFKVMQGTTVVADSTVLTADATMRTNRRVTWTTPTLPGGAYTGWCQLYDEFEEKSDVKTWAFTVETSSLIPDLDPANVDDPDPLKTVSTTPGFKVTWDDDASTAMTFMTVLIRQQDTGEIVRGPQVAAESIADGASATKSGAAWFTAASWPPLTAGESYRFETRGWDGSTWSGYSVSSWFSVNAAPLVPTMFSPVNGKGVTSIPFLSAYFVDSDDESVDLASQFYIRAEGDVTDGTLIPASAVWLGNGRWGVQPTSSQVTALGDWEWRARAVDPVGGVGTYSAWQSFTYTVAPDITFTNPAAPMDSIETTTPVLAWTVDRVQTSYRVRLYRTSYTVWAIQEILAGLLGIPFEPSIPAFYDSGYYHSSTGSHTLPTGKVVNNSEYVFVLDVRTSDGLEAQETTGFVVDYDERGRVNGFDVVRVQGPFESIPNHASIVDILWDAIPTTTPAVLAADFGGEVRITDTTGEITPTITGPQRFVAMGTDGAQGMLVEESTTNLVGNPLHGPNATGWTGTTRDTTWTLMGQASGLIMAAGANADGTYSLTIPASTHTLSAVVRNNAASARTIQLRYNGAKVTITSLLPSLPGGVVDGDAAIVSGDVQIPAGAVVRVAGAITGTAGAAAAGVRIVNSAAAETFNIGHLQVEAKAYATSPTPYVDSAGTIQSGYTWTGTAHASTSTRAETAISFNSGGSAFDSVNGMIAVSGTFGDRGTNDQTLFGSIHSGSGNRVQIIRRGTDKRVYLGLGPSSYLVQGPIVADGEFITAIGWWTGGQAWLDVNGVTYGPVAEAMFFTEAVVQVGRISAATNLLGGAVGRIAFANRVLTDVERSSLRVSMETNPSFSQAGMFPYATDAEFGGYVVRRENLDTGEVERMERLPGRNLNGYTDREARSGFNYRWSVSYLYLFEDVEWVESVPGVEEFSLNLVALVLSDLQQDGLSVPIYWWDDRAITRHTATEVVATLGEKPITFQGVLNYRALSLSFHTVDDPYGAYTAVEHFEAIEAFASVAHVGSNGKPIPRDICLRTPTRILMYGSLVSPIVRNDDHDLGKISGTLQWVENATHLEEDS